LVFLVDNPEGMMRQGQLTVRIIVYLAIYLLLYYAAGHWGYRLLYPIRIFVTFLHESGHALAALLGGGEVQKIQINADGSGWTRSAGGVRSLTIMGGYLGSALFGNIIFYIGARKKVLVKPLLVTLALAMLMTAIIWYNSMVTSLILMIYATGLLFLTNKTGWGRELLLFLGLASIVYIIQDFGVGPRSDLEAYAKELVIFPVFVWKYLWLFIVLLLFIINLNLLFKATKSTSQS